MFIAEGFFRVINLQKIFPERAFILNPELSYPRYYKKDAELFWRIRPNQSIKGKFFMDGVYHINSKGYRDYEFTDNKTKNMTRIIIMGNSCTFGWNVDLEETYAKILEKLLNQNLPETGYEVINAGMTGYSTYQGLRLLKREILKLHPDIILISYGWNDMCPSERVDKEQKFPPQWILNLDDFLSFSRFYSFLKFEVMTLLKYGKNTSREKSLVYRVSIEDYLANLGEMARIAKEAGIKVMFLSTPVSSARIFLGPGKTSKPHIANKYYNNALKDFSPRINVPLIDVATLFDGRGDLYDNGREEYIHYNAKGHQVIAEAIFQYFQKEGIAQ
ncbi:MAG: SGNH/GDSL hydrolase family protein [candidate division Zixibacteria bacterium]|nr:SGNH/GDSL hydrolase family protein [candidate division Zixibacteria bacterium]